MHPTYSFHSETNYDLTIVYWVHEYHDRCLIRNRKWLFFTLWLSFDFIGGWAGSCISFKLRVFLVFCYLFFCFLLFFCCCFLFFVFVFFFFLLFFSFTLVLFFLCSLHSYVSGLSILNCHIHFFPIFIKWNAAFSLLF